MELSLEIVEGIFEETRQDAIYELIHDNRSPLPEEECSTLPTIKQLRDAFRACMKEIAGFVHDNKPKFYEAIDQPYSSYKDHGIMMDDLASAIVACENLRSLYRDMCGSEKMSATYKDTMRKLLAYRHGDRNIRMGDPQPRDTFPFDLVVKYLPEATRTPFSPKTEPLQRDVA